MVSAFLSSPVAAENFRDEATIYSTTGRPSSLFQLDGNTTMLAYENVTDAVFDEAAHVRSHLGWRYRHIGESVTLTIVYLLVLVTGLVGNVSTCIVLARNRAMHSPTNYYLLSLAVSDVLTLCLGLPPELYAIWEAYPWRFGEPYCLFKSFLTEVTSTASVLTISGFTVERYLAIRWPLRTWAGSGLRRATRMIVAIWLIASVTSVPYPLNTRAFYYVTNPRTGLPLWESYVCNIPTDWMPRMKVVFLVYSMVLFVVPMIVIVCLYTSIGLTLRRRSRHEAAASAAAMLQMTAAATASAGGTKSVVVAGSGVGWKSGAAVVVDLDSKKRTSMLQRRRRSYKTASVFYSCRQAVLKVLVAVVVTFFVCWAPFHAQRILTSCVRDDQWTPGLMELQHGLFYLSGVLYYVSSTINPILYNVMSRKFRAAFQRTLCGFASVPSPCDCCGLRRRKPTNRLSLWTWLPACPCCFRRRRTPSTKQLAVDSPQHQASCRHDAVDLVAVRGQTTDRHRSMDGVEDGRQLSPRVMLHPPSSSRQDQQKHRLLSQINCVRRFGDVLTPSCTPSRHPSAQMPSGASRNHHQTDNSSVEMVQPSRRLLDNDSVGGGVIGDDDDLSSASARANDVNAAAAAPAPDDCGDSDGESVSSLPSTLAAYIREELEL